MYLRVIFTVTTCMQCLTLISFIAAWLRKTEETSIPLYCITGRRLNQSHNNQKGKRPPASKLLYFAADMDHLLGHIDKSKICLPVLLSMLSALIGHKADILSIHETQTKGRVPSRPVGVLCQLLRQN